MVLSTLPILLHYIHVTVEELEESMLGSSMLSSNEGISASKEGWIKESSEEEPVNNHRINWVRGKECEQPYIVLHSLGAAARLDVEQRGGEEN